eukprot:2384805-Amphidinium_carterae.2
MPESCENLLGGGGIGVRTVIRQHFTQIRWYVCWDSLALPGWSPLVHSAQVAVVDRFWLPLHFSRGQASVSTGIGGATGGEMTRGGIDDPSPPSASPCVRDKT